MVDALHQHENVHLFVADERQRDHAVSQQSPDREVIDIDAVGPIEHGGAMGCVTQPQPLGAGQAKAPGSPGARIGEEKPARSNLYAGLRDERGLL
jgi:hypothetical protein